MTRKCKCSEYKQITHRELIALIPSRYVIEIHILSQILIDTWDASEEVLILKSKDRAAQH